MPKSKDLRSLIADISRERGFEPKILEQNVFGIWREYLGKPLGTKTIPVAISNGVLKVYTEYPPYRVELLLNRQKIIAYLNAELGQSVLTDLRVELRYVGTTMAHDPVISAVDRASAREDHGGRNDDAALTEAELEHIETAVVDVADADLQAALRQLFTTQRKDRS